MAPRNVLTLRFQPPIKWTPLLSRLSAMVPVTYKHYIFKSSQMHFSPKWILRHGPRTILADTSPKRTFLKCGLIYQCKTNNDDSTVSKLLCLDLKRLTTVFFGIGVDLFKSISRMEGLLRFPSYYTTFSIHDQIS